MLILSVLLVIFSGLMNAIWNFAAKKSKNKAVFLSSIMLVASAALMPQLVIELTGSVLPARVYLLIALSMIVQGCYSYLLARTYVFGDLSQMYPIMRGTGVVFIPLIGVLFLGESLSMVGWAGVAGIAAGMFLLSGWQPREVFDRTVIRAVTFALSVGLCITCYTVIDKMTLQYLSPLALLQISNLGFMLVHLPQMFEWKQVREEWRMNWRLILIGSLVSPGSYLLFLFAMDMAPVSYLAPIREVGTVFATLLGIFLLKEKQGVKRIATTSFIALGIVIIGIGR